MMYASGNEDSSSMVQSSSTDDQLSSMDNQSSSMVDAGVITAGSVTPINWPMVDPDIIIDILRTLTLEQLNNSGITTLYYKSYKKWA